MNDGPTKSGDYLWDRSGDPDPEVVRLELLLSALRYRGAPPALHQRSGRAGSRLAPALAAAAVVLLAAAGAWFAFAPPRDLWIVRSLGGAPIVESAATRGAATSGIAAGQTAALAVGQWLVTDGSSRARIDVGQIGRVVVEPNTRMQLLQSRAQEHRMSLERGTIRARISAPPKFFFVNTPSAVAVDLGCQYTLQVDDGGAGLIRVTQGWVAFEDQGRQAFVPEGAVCSTRPRAGPGTPYYEDAPPGYGNALSTLDFGGSEDPRRNAALDLVLSSARRRDAFTLWHLLARGTAEERARVYDRLATLAPPPPGISRAAVLRGERAALDQWWDTLGIDSRAWWRLWKKKQFQGAVVR